MEIEITTLTPELGITFEALQKRFIAAIPKGSKFVPVQMYYQMAVLEQGKNVFCALVNGKLAGYGALIQQLADPDSFPELANIIWVYILAEHGIEIARLEIKENNLPAAQLYQSMGYVITSREEQWAKTI